MKDRTLDHYAEILRNDFVVGAPGRFEESGC